MQRFIARLTVVWLLVGVFAPAALAMSVPAPHACCKRKPMAMALPDTTASQARVSERQCANHDCCRSMAVSQRSEGVPCTVVSIELRSTSLLRPSRILHHATESLTSTLVRGPPPLS